MSSAVSKDEQKRRYDNSCCRSNLQDAIRSIRKAETYWPFVHAEGLVETLQQLKAKIKSEVAK
jgi:hypothetical protein